MAEVYAVRQSKFFEKLPPNSVVIIPNNPRVKRSNDTNYRYRANSYMLYLCGCNEPDTVWYADNIDGKWITKLYVRDNDTSKEIWEGRILGVSGSSEIFPVDFTIDIVRLDDDISKSPSEPLIYCEFPPIKNDGVKI